LDDSQLMFRVDGPLAARLGLDRRGELEILDTVAKAGIGPEVVGADPEQGWLLTRYVPGEHWCEQALKDPVNLERLAQRLKQLHELPPVGPLFDPGRIARGYARQLGTEAARRLADDIESRARELYSGTDPAVICHNDLIAANIIESEPLTFIDWEYAAVGDPYFDLAVIVGEHGLDISQIRRLLENWSGGHTSEQHSRLEAFGGLYDGLARLWHLLAGSPCTAGVSPKKQAP
jgi:thiamine kinase-like enzyme